MKKFLNAHETLLDESLDGFAAAHSDIVVVGEGRKFVRRRTLAPGKVALISGGGSGHEPLHAGFVGFGMLDAACPGQIFTSPTPDQMVAAVEAVDQGPGVVFIVKNYEGDVMNFEMAAEMTDGRCTTIVTDDDVAVETSTYSTGRRGVAGTLIVEKIVGAAAEKGMGRADLQTLGQTVNRRTRSMGVALTSCTVPAAGKPNFDLGADEMEMGVGIHGEPGRRRVKLGRADAIADEMTTAIMGDLGNPPGGRSAAPDQRLRRHAAHRALSHVQCGAAPAREARSADRALAGRQPRHLARDGGVLDHRKPARSGDDRALGSPGSYGGAPMVKGSRDGLL